MKLIFGDATKITILVKSLTKHLQLLYTSDIHGRSISGHWHHDDGFVCGLPGKLRMFMEVSSQVYLDPLLRKRQTASQCKALIFVEIMGESET